VSLAPVRHAVLCYLEVAVSLGREWRAPELPPEFNLAVAAGINNKSLCNILALKDKDQVAGIGRAPTSISLIVETVLE
jgi:hypothetical protein